MNNRNESRIFEMFAACKASARPAFMVYFPIGFPDLEFSLELCSDLLELGVSGLELGVPFSDPLLDGPSIQSATQKALNNGTKLSDVLEVLHELRRRHPKPPLLNMSSLNPLLAYGVDTLLEDISAAGGDGLIIPDLPLEESQPFQAKSSALGLTLVQFLAPTSGSKRIRSVCQAASRGFIYVMALTGTTGARSQLPEDTLLLLDRIREVTETPLVLGFGISRAEQIDQLRDRADGFIVGSAIVDAALQGKEKALMLAKELKHATA